MKLHFNIPWVHMVLGTLLLTSCIKSTSTKTVTPIYEYESGPNNIPDQVDHIDEYVKHSNSPLLKFSRENGEEIEALLDRLEEKDGIQFMVYNIGYTVTDSGGRNPRFTSDCWIYIDSLTKTIYEYDLYNDTIVQWNKPSQVEVISEKIPSNGKYLFDVAFAEWNGKSLGVKVTVVIQDDSVKVIYEGQGSLAAEFGEVIDEGILIKHKTGKWIIGLEISDKDLDEIGGCTGGPAIIDFKNKKYWMC